MVPLIGYLTLVSTMIVSLYVAIMSLVGVRLGKKSMIASAERAAIAIGVLVVISYGSLLYSFLSRDFSVRYVYEYSNRALSTIYTISATWAGNNGSLLMWATFLGIYAAIVIIQNQHRNRESMPYVTIILSLIIFFFTSLMVFMSNPFERLPIVPADGQGLNPMLHNPGMYLHPPTTYLGYVSFAIPFAFAMAAMISGKLGDMWIRTTRRWIIWGWFWLTVGNLVGAWWAYYTLGWGGYWGWDPVENSSFMPWLVASAFMHSIMIQEKKGMLKIWNMALVTLTFSLTIYGTLITRSGIVNSVHTFSQSGLGPYLGLFLFTILAFGFGMLIYRLPQLKSDNELDSIISRESAFLFNNIVLLGMTFMVLWGVTFPFISEAVTGSKITVGAPFYNQMAVPLGMVLLFLMGFGPLIAWRRATVANLRKNFMYPLGAAMIAIPALAAIGVRNPWVLSVLVLCVFVLATIIFEFYRGTRARHRMTGEDILTSFTNLVWRNKRRYGGYIVHIGLVMIFFAIAGGPYKIEKDVTMKPGDQTTIGAFTVKYIEAQEYEDDEKSTQAAVMAIFKGDRELETITPRKELYDSAQMDQPWTRVAVRSNLKEDLYIIPSGFTADGTGGFTMIINPLMQWMWVAGFVIFLGTIIAYWPDPTEKRRLAAIYARQEADNES